MPLVEVTGIVKDYVMEDVPTHVLRNVSLTVEQGEFLSIMGASGSGKSTLMHLLGLLERPTAGTYMFDGHNINALSDEELAAIRNSQIGFVFQAFHLLPRVSVLENVIIPLYYSAVPKREWQTRAIKVLERVGMGHRLHFKPTQISGGEKQRTALARSLVVDPKLILADEPTGNLDSKNGQAVLQLIADLNNSGHTIILVTHDSHAAHIGKRIITMQDGQITQDKRLGSQERFLPQQKSHDHS